MMPSSSSSSATVRVEKATSDLLIGPDWTMNMDICDSINSNRWDAKDVVKAVKKRLQHKNPRIQLLALTLLETMVKNCGDYVHSQIAERNILQDMVKIVKKKTDMHVRDKILVLLDSWQEALGGHGGRFPQYYWAYEELRRSGVVFPQRSLDAAPIFTPPVAQSTLRHAQAGYGMPINSSTRLDEAMAAEMENLSLSIINSMRTVLDLLADMLQAVNPSDRASVKDEVIVDLINRCRSNQRKLMQMLTTTGDEDLLAQGLELNDSLQSVLAKHDAIASGSPLPTQVANFNPRSSAAHTSSPEPTYVKESSQTLTANNSALVAASVGGQVEKEEDEEDDFAQLARRHSKTRSTTSIDSSTGTSESVTSVPATNNAMSSIPATAALVPSNALALPDPPAPVRTTKEQDMIDLLSLALTTTTASPHAPVTPVSSSFQNIYQGHVSSPTQGYPYASQAYFGNQGQVPSNSYVVPWAQPQPQPQPQPHSQPQPQPQPRPQPLDPQNQPQYPQFSSGYRRPPQPQPQPQPQRQSQTHSQPQLQSQPLQPQTQPQHPRFSSGYRPPSQPQPQPQPQSQPQPRPQPQQNQPLQPQTQPQYSQLSYGYPPPPWAPTPGYFSNQNHLSTPPYTSSTPRANTFASYTSMQPARSLQHVNLFPARSSNGLPMNGEASASSAVRTSAPAAGQKTFVPSYRLFEDLNVLGNGDGRFHMTSSTSSSLSGNPSQSMVGGRK
ncbi:TOM1-like protein 6 [Actinidia eriantha]|uniref:TOM1-like protein 6 n=1 Tax=Actinidia eriantha TaxID=165200 RepID=UPI00258B7C01|nr:TOM1-like protein 6 [Actinidia eriantha]